MLKGGWIRRFFAQIVFLREIGTSLFFCINKRRKCSYLLLLKILVVFVSISIFTINYSYAFDVTVSSSLNKTNYDANKLFDNNLDTAWCAKTKENLIININNIPAKIKKIGIVNGYVKNDTTFKNNARIKDIDVVVGGNSQSFELADSSHFQVIIVVSSNKFKMIIHSFYPGRKYNELCVSEIIVDSKLITALEDVDRIENMEKALTEYEIKTKIGHIYKVLGPKLTELVDIRMQNYDLKTLRLILDLIYYADKYDTVTNAELLEYLTESIECYFVNLNEIVYKILHDSKQKNKEAIVNAFDNYFSSFYYDEGKNKFTDKRYTPQFIHLKTMIDNYRIRKKSK